MSTVKGLSWLGIARLGLIQTALGAIIVLTTSTLNRVMVVEMALPAMLPGFLVAIHHFVQLARPRIGFGSDIGGRRTPWIVGGMLLLAVSGVVASLGTVLMAHSVYLGSAVSFLGFFGIGLGSGATGTSLLVLLAKVVAPERKPAAATLVWFMMIAGFAVTAGVAGHFLDPFSPARLLLVTGTVSVLAFSITLLAIRGVEPSGVITPVAKEEKPAFLPSLRRIWQERQARQFTLFVLFHARLLLPAPDSRALGWLVLADARRIDTVGGHQYAGVLLGMVAVAASDCSVDTASHCQACTVGGWPALVLLALASGGLRAEDWHLSANVFLLGFANGAFAVAAIAAMMTLASAGEPGREGLRMGLWGASQAIAFALGGFLGTVAVDVCRIWIETPAHAYGLFTFEALFLIAALLGRASAKVMRKPCPKRHPVLGTSQWEVMPGSN